MLSSLYRNSTADHPVLRVGILLHSMAAPQLYGAIVEDIEKSSFARLDLVINVISEEPRPRKSLLFGLYEKWDRSRISPAEDPFAVVNLATRLAAVETVETAVRPDGALPESTIDVIRAKGLDVLLIASPLRLTGAVLDSTQHGVWAYRFGDGQRYEGIPPHFWEVRDQSPTSGVVLLRLGGAGNTADRVLCQATFESRVGDNVSWAQNRIRPGWGSTSFVIQKLAEIHRGRGRPPRSVLPPRSAAPRRSGNPGNWEIVRWLAPKLAGVVRRKLRPPRTEHWKMAIRLGTQRLWKEGRDLDTAGFTWIPSEPGHLYADPFLIRHQGRLWLFYEHYRYAEGRADIDCAEVLPDGTLSGQRLALRCPYHLSFPYVFEHKGEMFMLPETGNNRTVELYRAVRFPDHWKREKILYTGNIVDTAIWNDHHGWWFFATLKGSRGGNGSTLLLFHASELTGEWKLHPASPVNTDACTARGAGALFLQDGRLLRPSQDGTVRYGYRLNFNEIKTLNPEQYEERLVLTVDPSHWDGLIGIHTYNQCPGAEVIDGCTWVSKTATVENQPTSSSVEHATEEATVG